MNIAIWIIFGFSVLFWCVDFYLFSVVIPHWEGMLKTVNQKLPILTMLVLQLANVRHFFVIPIAIQLTAGVILKNRKGLAIQIVGLVTAFSLIILSFLGPYLAIYQLSR
jgi:type II secretory pathway component PulF